MQHSGRVKKNEIMVEIYSKRLVRTIGKVSYMKFAITPIKTHEGDENRPLFVNK